VVPQNQGDPLLLYEYPTWSRDGNQLAFISVKSDGKELQSKIMVAHMGDKSVDNVYASNSDHPVYLNWSPDNVNVSFIAGDASGQNASLQSVSSQGGNPTILDTGSPFYYWSWAPNGHEMIVHAAGDALALVPEHVAFLSVGSKTVTKQALDSKSASSQSLSSTAPQTFQAPAWSPDGSHIALARATDKENQIIVTDATGKNPKKIGTFTAKTAFAWSSDSTRIAYIDGARPMDPGIFGALHVIDLQTSKEVTKDGKIIAFFWSPNGEELAYFNLVQMQSGSSSSDNSGSSSTPQLGVELHVLDVTSGQDRALLTYIPTKLFMSILPYFDQYDQSVTIWSPDNNNLVLSLLDDTGEPSIAIVPASGKMDPRILTKGFVAFWSWN
jgi:Tol biopolymer transport system component